MLHKMETLPLGTKEGDARRRLEELKEELRSSEAAPQRKRERLTVSAYAEQWLEAKAARVRPSVADRYTTTLAHHILPTLGEMYLDELTRADIESWVATAEHTTLEDGSPYSGDTVLGWWRVLLAMVRDAMAEFGLDTDPTFRVRPPKRPAAPKREKRTLTAEQMGQLVWAVKQYTPDRFAEVFVLCFTGMRAGEVFALRWVDVDFEQKVIHVRRSVWHGHENATKTDDPRDVPLTDELAEVLRGHRRSQLSGQHKGLEKGLVFPADNGAYRLPQSLQKALALAVVAAKLGIHVTPQVLRRSFNTALVRAGVDRIVLRSIMGHTTEEMTRRYSGIDLASKHEAVARLVPRTETH